MILKYLVKKSDNNKMLKIILKKNLNISNRLLIKLKEQKLILLNNINCNVTTKVKTNDIVELNLNISNNIDSFASKYLPYNFDLDILYEDEYLLVIDKPKDMPSHPVSNNQTTTLANALLFYFIKTHQTISNIHIISRLDKNTCGVCLIAKNKYIQELFIRKKEKINLKKEYIAYVNNIVETDHFIIEKNIVRNKDSIITRTVSDTEGDFAKTEVFTLYKDKKNNYSILKILLHTGRTHQIRVHLSSINHCILGDTLYANEYNISNEYITKFFDTQALLSNKISFIHPIIDKKIEINSKINLEQFLKK